MGKVHDVNITHINEEEVKSLYGIHAVIAENTLYFIDYSKKIEESHDLEDLAEYLVDNDILLKDITDADLYTLLGGLVSKISSDDLLYVDDDYVLTYYDDHLLTQEEIDKHEEEFEEEFEN